MINIVHPFFCSAVCPRNTRSGRSRARVVTGLVGLMTLASFIEDARAMPGFGIPARAGMPAKRVSDITIPCVFGLGCVDRPVPGRPPGPPDRDARPFEGTLGRPCAYRSRFTPSGTRRVRVCF